MRFFGCCKITEMYVLAFNFKTRSKAVAVTAHSLKSGFIEALAIGLILTVSRQPQIATAIIEAIAVYMIDQLVSLQRAAQYTLKNNAMQTNKASIRFCVIVSARFNKACLSNSCPSKISQIAIDKINNCCVIFRQQYLDRISVSRGFYFWSRYSRDVPMSQRVAGFASAILTIWPVAISIKFTQRLNFTTIFALLEAIKNYGKLILRHGLLLRLTSGLFRQCRSLCVSSSIARIGS